MGVIREFFRVVADVARVIPVTLAKQPAMDDPASIAMVFEDTVKRYPDRNMLVFEGREVSWSEFNELSNSLAHALIARGVKRDDCVSVIMENRIEMLASIMAVQKIGAIAGLVNPGLVGAQLVHCMNVTNSVKCLAGEEIFNSVLDVRADLDMDDADILWVADLRESSPPESMEDIMAQVDQYPVTNLDDTKTILAGATACYIFTSGTTGMPKAAKVGQRRLMAAGYSFSRIGVRAKPEDRMYLCLPLFHGTGFICGVCSALHSGSSMFLRRKFSASSFWPEIQKYQCTIFFYVGELCRYLVTQPPCPEELNNPLDRVFGNGLRPDVWDEFKGRFGIDRVCEFYGASEGNLSFLNAFNKDKTIGFCPGTILLLEYDVEEDKIVLDDKGAYKQVESGQPGLLIGEIDERYRFDGYTDGVASESKILRDVLKAGDTWFNTGDLIVEVDVGFTMGKPHYQFVDRIGDTFRWRSENVSTNEVGEILNANQQVEIANVYGVDVPATEGKAGMVSLALKPGKIFDADEFSTYVSANLPGYAQPVFIRIQSDISTTGTFKLIKGDLRKQAFHLQQLGDDAIYVMMPRSKAYQKLDQLLYESIIDGSAGY
ncbi:MAG: long-chain-acyl-CoA synthetase [Proteobacteria bacterium]|nr:long-chain-acyl-CoA synthetase [Pseudomonadota bacterium]MDA1351920.1 long-chain-acyl-CoA synthetase [Pseudomonadota bacterium]